MTTTYDEQAESFLAKHGIRFRATLSDSKTVPWSDSEHSVCGSKAEKSRHHYRVTLSKPEIKNGAMVKGRSARLTFDFWGCIADAEKGLTTVTPYDVLSCISSDVNCPETFADFCDEYGYEADSIKALQLFRRCDRFSKRLRAFFTAAEIEQLAEIQ